jgi:hypothetical protein
MKQPNKPPRKPAKRQLLELQVKESIEQIRADLRNAIINIRPLGGAAEIAAVREVPKCRKK